MTVNFSYLEQVSASINFLDAVKSTHSEPFAAIAELVDNAYDAQAKNCYVSYDSPTATMEFLDDGYGMSPKEMLQVITFGHSDKTATNIGRYGIGLKTGAFHLGKEVMVLTKKDDIYTAMLLSTKFHKQNDIKTQMYVPCPSFTSDFQPLARSELNIQKHEAQLELIKKYGPLGGRSLQSLFDKIQGASGTLVIVGWIRKSTIMSGNYILDFGPADMRIHDDSRPHHHQSLRAFLSMLYLRPHMKIHLQGTPVLPTKICESWMGKFKAEIPTTNFKDTFQKCQEDRERNMQILTMDKEMVTSELAYIQPDELATMAGQGKKAQLVLRLREIESKMEAQRKEGVDIERLFKTDTVKVFCGVQTVNRSDNGIHFFMNNRLILWGHKGATFFKNDKSIGVCAIVNLDPAIFRPSASKQEFQMTLDFKLLVKKCNENLIDFFEFFETYWIENALGNLSGDDPVAEFWNKLGYADAYSTRGVQRRLTFDEDRLVALKKKECAQWFTCCRCGMWKRDNEGRVTDITNDRLQCKDVDRRGCRSANSKLTDDEGFNMDMVSWKKIQERMQKVTGPSTFTTPRQDTSTLSTSGPSTSGPSTSGPRATRSSGSSASKPIVLGDDVEQVAPRAADRSQVVVGKRAYEPSVLSIFRIPKRSAASGVPPSLSSTPRTSANSTVAPPMMDVADFAAEDHDEPPTPPSSPPAIDPPSAPAPTTPRDARRTGPVAPSASSSSSTPGNSSALQNRRTLHTSGSIKQEIKPVVRGNSTSSDEEAEPVRAPGAPQVTSSESSDDEEEDEDEEEEEEEPEVPGRAQAKVAKRKMSSSEPSDEEEEEEDQPNGAPVTVGKTAMEARKAINQAALARRTGARKVVTKKKKSVTAQKFNRIDCMENAVNELLKTLGHPPVPSGEFELDLVSLFKRHLAPDERARDAVKEKVNEMSKDIEDVLEITVQQPGVGLTMPHIHNPIEKLDAMARQIRTKNQQQRQQSGGRKGPSARK